MRRRLVLSLFALFIVTAPAVEPTRDVIASLRPYITSKAMAGAVTLVVDQERVLSHQTIGMADTTSFPTAEQLARLAKAYKPNVFTTAG